MQIQYCEVMKMSFLNGFCQVQGLQELVKRASMDNDSRHLKEAYNCFLCEVGDLDEAVSVGDCSTSRKNL